MLWTFSEIVTLVLAMLATGVICGAPLWFWVYSLPVPLRRPSGDPDELADQLEAIADALRDVDEPDRS